MKRVLKSVLIFTLCFISFSVANATEDIPVEELLEMKHENEVVLNIDNKLVLDTDETLNTKKEKNFEANKSAKKRLFNFDFVDLDGDGIPDNNELYFEIFKLLDKEKEINEDSLFGKIYHNNITRTDIPTFLLQDDLTFNYEKGPISKVHAYGAYRGAVNFRWDNNYSTDYDNLVNQFGVYGQFRNPNYKFKFAANPIPSNGLNYADKFVADAYLVNTSIPNHQISLGYSRVQTGVEGGVSTYTLPFVARSQIARNYGGAKSIALKVLGNYQYMDYNLSLGSSGRYITSGMPGAEFNGWVNVKPFGNKSKKYGKLTIGGGLNAGHNRIDYNVLSGYIGYQHKKLWTNFEVGVANGYSGLNGISSNKSCGYAATLGWKFNPHWQIIGRVDQFDPNTNISGDLKHEYTLGLNWFIKGQALKVILNYVFSDSQNQPDSHKIILATQILI